MCTAFKFKSLISKLYYKLLDKNKQATQHQTKANIFLNYKPVQSAREIDSDRRWK